MDALNSVNTNSYQSAPKQVSDASSGSSVDLSAISASMSAASSQVQNKVAQQPSDEDIQSAISSANKRAHFGHTSAEFAYDKETHRISIKLLDKDTNEVIKEVPSEETLEMISKLYELAGLMVDEKR